MPALETSHALIKAFDLAKKFGKDDDIVVSLSGRGDKDVAELANLLQTGWSERLNWKIA